MRQASEEKAREEVIDTIAGRVGERWSGEDAPLVETFVRQYFEGAAPEDVIDRRPDDLYGAALCHWNLGEVRAPEQVHIRVYNPDAEQNGWQSTHTVCEVVAPDMPFLVDSVSMALNRLGLTIHLIIHPVLTVRRGEDHRVAEIPDVQQAEGAGPEAWMHFEVDRQSDQDDLERIRGDIASVIEDVRLAVGDWRSILGRLEEAMRELESRPPPIDADRLEEVSAFLRWIHDDHFTLLGYRRYELSRKGRRDELRAVADSGLGILRAHSGDERSESFAALPASVKALARDPEPLVLTKSNSRATVHRPGYMDYIGIKRFDANGEVIGEHRFLGLFTSAAYHRSPRTIPLLRRKIEQILEQANLRPNSHAGKALINILETHPRDELFQASTDELYETAKGILHLQERQRVRLFVRYDTFRRFVSCLVYAPRERYNTDVRERMQSILVDTFSAENAEFSVQLSESVLARIHFIVRLAKPGKPSYDHDDLERRLAHTMHSWRDDLSEAMLEYFGEARGNRLLQRYGDGFSAAYREDTVPRAAIHDVERLEHISGPDDLGIVLYRPLEAPPEILRLRLFQYERPIVLSDALPVLEHMGVEVVDERPYEVHLQRGGIAYIHDFGLRYASAGQREPENIRTHFQDAFSAVWHRRAEDDGFNRLVLAAGLTWEQIVILRAYARYLRQAGLPFSQQYLEETFANNATITRRLARLFAARLDPDSADESAAAALGEEIEGLLEEVTSLDEDRILRRMLAAVQATLRTNFYRRDSEGRRREFVSLKLDPRAIPGVPKPVPAYEIFVYSPRVEGVHLRGGKVARGGIRWSDRREDYRTEILGLMKAQMVKNAVIVPMGAKGGFVCKQLPEDRQAAADEVLAGYRIFIRALLDVTDNIAAGEVSPPPQVLRHDDDDPYLVVAADKGTATFSDYANELSDEYGFWLGDAFASGGSSGYDHKKMAITARGAWVAVQRHFRELGRDIQSEPFTAVGIGDMSGDVFGNGMLLSEQTRLIAAFDHRHIFIDPDPDPETGYAERQRLFGLARSSWEDYDRSRISTGGGVWPRSAKSIQLSAAARQALGISGGERLTPLEVISAILRAPVDLLWNGGIGTYIKSSEESHADVGDKANDALRVDAGELRCRVIGEGGNLGLTQLARVEFAMHGGRVNSDAIDNSGGVDCSDHEVNIKILLNRTVDDGDLTTKQRNHLLADMTDEVARLVLANNYRQTQGLSLLQHHSAELIDEHGRFMRDLERGGRLDRAVEHLPDDEGLMERGKVGGGLTRPELAVLLAYAKIEAYPELLGSELVASDYLSAELMRYFPQPLRERYRERIEGHPLRAEITATVVTNHILNRMGATFLFRIRARTGVDAADAARAYFAARDIFRLRELWHEVDALDNRVSATTQLRVLDALCNLQERATLWLLRNLPSPLDIEETVARISPAVRHLGETLDELVPEEDRRLLETEVEDHANEGVPEELGRRVARLDALYAALDLVKVASDTGARLREAAEVYYTAGTRLELGWLREAITEHPVDDPWQERYRAGMEEEFFVQLRRMAVRVLRSGDEGTPPAERLEHWIRDNKAMVERLAQTITELRKAAQVDLPMLGVALQELRNLGQAGAAQQLVTGEPA
ncbi:NAD-glutamate dehydrogenase [Arhodomonas aquaeolei]|uniref:NAD-glutamate dehydrogenase n=1 Tax=Arhodomonas aquaeolei TaxID=2369 RepID=UPI000373FB23|nr:NAD-glutamate dehydrogenase [Arhodomonas aquaeolei]